MGLNYVKQLISCEDMTSQTDNHLGNLCCESHCFIVLHTFSKIYNFLISYSILLKLFLIVLSDFSAFIESKLFFEWTCPLMRESRESVKKNSQEKGTEMQIHFQKEDNRRPWEMRDKDGLIDVEGRDGWST